MSSVNPEHGYTALSLGIATGLLYGVATATVASAFGPGFVTGAATGALCYAKDALLDESANSGHITHRTAKVAKEILDFAIIGGSIALMAGLSVISLPVAGIGIGAYSLNKFINWTGSLMPEENKVIYKSIMKTLLVAAAIIGLVAFGALTPIGGLALGAIGITVLLIDAANDLRGRRLGSSYS